MVGRAHWACVVALAASLAGQGVGAASAAPTAPVTAPIVAASDAPSPIEPVTLPRPPVATMASSWQPTFVEGVAVGGRRTVTITNDTTHPWFDVTVDLGPAPCSCSVFPTDGVVGSSWSIDVVRPGVTVELTVEYLPSGRAHEVSMDHRRAPQRYRVVM